MTGSSTPLSAADRSRGQPVDQASARYGAVVDRAGGRVRLIGTVASVGLAVALAACGAATVGSSRAGPPSTPAPEPSSSTTPTTMPTNPFVTALPVVACPTSYGAGARHPFVARELPAEGGTAGLSFYSNGLLTVLAPTGWSCSALVAADGGQRLDAYPPGGPDLSTTPAAPGTELVQIDGEWTGHGPGALFICPLFPGSPAATFMHGSPPCPQAPPGQVATPITTDVVGFQDPAGTRGTGAGSGGSLVSRGAAVYPQAGSPEPAGGMNVYILSCTLGAARSRLCPAVEADFLVRYAPSYAGAPG